MTFVYPQSHTFFQSLQVAKALQWEVPPNCDIHDSPPFSYAPPDTLAWIYLFYEAKPCAHFKAGREAFDLLWSKGQKQSSHPKNPILSPPSCCRHVVVECQYSRLTIKIYYWLLLVCSPKTTSRKPLASGFFLNFWHSHLYNQTPSSHRIHQSIARVVLLSTNPTTNLLVLFTVT